MVHLHQSAKTSKQEFRNRKKMAPFIKWRDLMKEAKGYKEMYLELKNRPTDHLSDRNKDALAECITFERENAMECFTKSEQVKKDFPHIIEMIKTII